MFVLLALLSLLLSFFTVKIYRELEIAKRSLYRYKHLSSQENYQNELATDIEFKKRQKSQLKSESEQLSASIDSLSKRLAELKEEDYLESFGFYQPKYDFISAGSYESLLKDNRDRQRKMIKEKTAAVCHTSWSLGGSEKAGKKMATNFLKLVLTIFNNECDAFISKIKHSSNVDSVEAKMRNRFDRLNKNSVVINCEITVQYLKLKVKQLHLQYQREVERYEESEREKAIREEMRDRKKLAKIEKQAEEAEERENRFQQELENALKEQELSYGVEKQKLEVQVQRLRQEVEKARDEKEEANAQAAMEKAGYIYIVSNIGSLGRNTYRIWMTRSSEPDKSIDIMSRAVPFPFDVHLKFMSEEATDTMARLQSTFSDKRVNKINERRNFFNVSLEEILQAVKDIREETGVIKGLQFKNQTPSAYEYRRTQAIERNNRDSQPSRDSKDTNKTA